METSKLTSKGQITLPKPIRDALGLKAGDTVHFSQERFGVKIIPARTRDIRELKGIVKWDGPPLNIEDIDRAIAKHLAEKMNRTKNEF